MMYSWPKIFGDFYAYAVPPIPLELLDLFSSEKEEVTMGEFFETLAILAVLCLGLIFFLLFIISMWKLFRKAGQSGWKLFVPVYNIMICHRIIQKPFWVSFLILLPPINVFPFYLVVPWVNLITFFYLGFCFVRAYDKGRAFGFLGVFLFWALIPFLAFGSAKYIPRKMEVTTNR